MKWLIDMLLESVKGVIVMWSGLEGDIPDGWHICDGTGGTPNLTYRFIIGSGVAIPPGTTGGTCTHSHDDYSNNETTELDTGDAVGPGGAYDRYAKPHNHRIVTTDKNHMPPYYSLCYIMKI